MNKIIRGVETKDEKKHRLVAVKDFRYFSFYGAFKPIGCVFKLQKKKENNVLVLRLYPSMGKT